MNNEFQRYAECLQEFQAILSFAEKFVNSLVGQQPSCKNDVYGERIFVKLLCHAVTLIKISPSIETNKQQELWDISSSYCLARALIESFDALSYIALANIDNQEKEFRLIFWKLHAEARRFNMLSKIGSTDPRVKHTEREVDNLKSKLLAHNHLDMCSKGLRKDIEKGNYQPYHLTQRQRNEEAGVSHEFRDVVTMHLSSHVHTHPFSVMQIVDFKAGSPESIGLMSIAIQYSSGFLAKAVQGMLQVFNKSTPVMDTKAKDAYSKWITVVENGVKKS
ncbi:hypothetical protein [Litoribrevibacter albus]|nr:hypothetical protein [Litoribrevibacter albus]